MSGEAFQSKPQAYWWRRRKNQRITNVVASLTNVGSSSGDHERLQRISLKPTE